MSCDLLVLPPSGFPPSARLRLTYLVETHLRCQSLSHTLLTPTHDIREEVTACKSARLCPPSGHAGRLAIGRAVWVCIGTSRNGTPLHESGSATFLPLVGSVESKATQLVANVQTSPRLCLARLRRGVCSCSLCSSGNSLEGTLLDGAGSGRRGRGVGACWAP